MTIQAKITGRIKIPNLDLSKTLLDIGNRDIISRMAKNIQRGIDLQERRYPPLAASTIRIKGHGRPLIQTGKLISSFFAKAAGKNRVFIRIKAVRREIAKFLQIDGIRAKTGRRRFNLFGVSTRMENDGRKRMEREIKKRIRNAR